MKRYTFTVEATSVYGHQCYYIDADNEAEARERIETGDGVFVYEELEVQDLGKYELQSVEEVPED